MVGGKVKTISVEQQLFSKEAISLSPKERLALLLKVEKYPIVRKKTSAEKQIEEMIDLYNICCIMLAKYFPNKQAKDNFFLLNLIIFKGETKTIVDDKLVKAFKVLNNYEELENKIISIQRLFNEYRETFPDIFELYNLQDFATEKISDIIENSQELLSSDLPYIKKLLERWGLNM